jgi:hypothetical protein
MAASPASPGRGFAYWQAIRPRHPGMEGAAASRSGWAGVRAWSPLLPFFWIVTTAGSLPGTSIGG